MSGILAAQHSGSCCCTPLGVAPCNRWDAVAEMRREDENGVPKYGELSVSVVGAFAQTEEYVCNGWVGTTAAVNAVVPPVFLRNVTGPMASVPLATQISPPAHAGTWSASYGVRLEDWSGFNCCRCAKGIPQPPPCPQNCDPPPFCPANLGLIAREHGNPLAPRCYGFDSVLHPFCQACTQPGGYEWAYNEYFNTHILLKNLYVSDMRLTTTNWSGGIVCGSTPSQGVEWILETAIASAGALCPDGSQPIFGGGGAYIILKWRKPCCHPNEGPVGRYLPWLFPQSGTSTSSDGCTIISTTSTFGQGYATVSRIAE